MKKVKSKLTFLAVGGIAIITAFSLGSCSKSSSGSSGPTPLGGYVSSDSVAPSNLIAYWPFDGDANDHKGGLTATTTGSIAYTTGVRGQAYQGSLGTYATYAADAAFSGLGSYTVSFWYKLPAEPTASEGIFFVNGTSQQGELINEIEPYTPVSGDSVRIHPGFWDIGDPAPNYQLFVPETFDTSAIGKWVFFTVSYNGGTSTYTTYENATPTGANEAFTSGKYITPNPLYTDGTMTTPLGALSFAPDPPASLVIGTWPDGLFGQSAATANFLGQLDEIRVFNTALTQQEISGLFLNGQAGR